MTAKGYFILLVFVYCYMSITSEGKKVVDKKQEGLVTNIFTFEDAKKQPQEKYDKKPSKNVVNPVVKIIPKVKKPVIVKLAEKKLTTKQKVWEKLRHVKSTADFLKHFQIDKSVKLRKVGVKQVAPKGPISQPGYELDMRSRDATSSTSTFQEFDCQPRPKVVEIPLLNTEDAAYWPTCAQLHQCSGCCAGGSLFYECAPIKLENRSTPVFKIPYDGSFPTLHQVYMLHHSACGCKCRVQPSDCTPGQTYDSKNCACVCQKSPQTCEIGKQWSDTACDCVCSLQNPSCPKRRFWNEKRCSCDCNTGPCPAYYIKDPSTCLCIPFLNKNPNKFSDVNK